METIERADDHKAAFGIFRRRDEIGAAHAALQSVGFRASSISVLHPLHKGDQEFPLALKTGIATGSMIGAGVGSLVFAIVGLVLGMRFGETFLESALLTLAFLFAGAILGAGAGALVGIGIPETSANRYGDYVDSGGILLSVRVENADEEREAQKALEEVGAQDITLLREGKGWDSVHTRLASHPS